MNLKNVKILLRRVDLDVNVESISDGGPNNTKGVEHNRWFALHFLSAGFSDVSPSPVILSDTLEILKLILSDPRTSWQHRRHGFGAFIFYNDKPLPIVSFYLDHEKRRVNADRIRLNVLRRQSAAGLRLPDHVLQFSLLPMINQSIFTQSVLDDVGEYSWYDHDKKIGKEARTSYQPLMDLLTTFLREYDNIHEFSIPTVCW